MPPSAWLAHLLAGSPGLPACSHERRVIERIFPAGKPLIDFRVSRTKALPAFLLRFHCLLSIY
eukprot:SAG22_NODE_152_length_17377_cov_191.856928_3_plen_63_part_00